MPPFFVIPDLFSVILTFFCHPEQSEGSFTITSI